LTPDYLFVYGTLLQNLYNELSKFLYDNSTIVGKAYFIGKLYKISWFPGAILSENNSEKVYGTFVKIKDIISVFNTLDPYEGFNKRNPKSSLFIRQLIIIFDENQQSYKAWVYLYNQKVNEQSRIISGDYLNDTGF